MAANLNDQLSWKRILADSDPTGIGPNTHGAEPKAGNIGEVEFPTFLWKEPS